MDPGHGDKHQGAGPRDGQAGQGHLTGGWTTDRSLSGLHVQEVLKHLQGKLEQEARVLVSSGQTEVLEQLKGEGLAWGPPTCTLGPTLARFLRELGGGGQGAC